MRTESKTSFRPSLERVEPRVVSTSGVVAAMAAHHPAPHHPVPHHPAHVAPKHVASHAAQHPSTTSTPTATPTHTSSTPKTTSTSTPPSNTSLPKDTSSNQAWVEIVNMTGQELEYSIKLGPYDNGQFIPFDIGGNGVQYRMSSLISGGQRVKADFAIQFGNGPVTPLMTGPDESSAQGYYIFLDSNLNYYVAPFIRS